MNVEKIMDWIIWGNREKFSKTISTKDKVCETREFQMNEVEEQERDWGEEKLSLEEVHGL